MRSIRRILIVTSLLFALGWFIPDGFGSNDSIAYWQASALQVDGNGAMIGDGTAYWQFRKHFMFEYFHTSHREPGKAGKGLGFMGDHRSVWLNYEAGNFAILIEGYWLEIAVVLGAFPVLHRVWGLLRRKSAVRGFALD